ncbi:MAG: DUF5683 domain-containing protein [Bacteroidales bacterium]
MKKLILFIFLNCLFFLPLRSQIIVDRSSNQRPSWLSEPPKGEAFIYYTGVGTSEKSIENAQKAALGNVISQISFEGATTIQVTSELRQEEERSIKLSGDEKFSFKEDFVEVIRADGEKFTINGLQKEEEYWQKVSDNGTIRYQYWVLMRTLKQGYSGSSKIREGYGLAPVWRSAIVPGWGQLYKKEKTKGIAILSATAVTVSGIIISQTMYNTSMNNAEGTHNIDLIDAYLQDADIWQTSRNIFSVAAAAIYIYNIVDAITAKGAKRYAYQQQKKVEFAPMMADQSVGLWVCIKF